MPLLVFPFLHGRGGNRVCRRVHQQTGGMADVAAGSSARLLGLSVVSPLSREARGGKETGRNRKTTCRGRCRPALAHDRIAGVGDRSQGPYLTPTPAAPAHFRGGSRE